MDGSEDPADLRRRGEDQVSRVRAAMEASSPLSTEVEYVPTEHAIAQWILEERRGPEHDTSTGWKDVDALLGKPMRHSEVILVAARTGVGKTWVLQGIIENALEHRPEASALLIQLEMPAFHQAERLVGHALNLAPGGARSRARENLTVEEVMQKAPMLERLGMVEQSLNVLQIPAAITAMEKATGTRPTIVALDYLGLLRGAGRTRYEIASEVSRELKTIAKSEQVLLLCAAQLSRDAGDGTKQPSLDSLRDSGVAEEAADRVLGLWRPQPIEDEAAPSIVDGVEIGVVILKNRFGPSGGEAKLQYDHTLRLVQASDDGIPW